MILKPKTQWPFFEYEEGMKIQIAYLDDDILQDLVNQSTKITFEKHQRKETTDIVKLRRKIVAKAMGGWEIKRKHIPFMIEPRDFELESGETWEDQIAFTPEEKERVLENLNSEFGEWVVGLAKDVAEHEKARKNQEKQNLSPGSPGSKAKKD